MTLFPQQQLQPMHFLSPTSSSYCGPYLVAPTSSVAVAKSKKKRPIVVGRNQAEGEAAVTCPALQPLVLQSGGGSREGQNMRAMRRDWISCSGLSLPEGHAPTM